MNLNLKTLKTRSAALVLGALMTSLAVGAQAVELPPVVLQGGVVYMTGGVDTDVAKLIDQQSRHWPVSLLFAVRDHGSNAYLANVKVTVRDRTGGTVLQTTSEGPYLLADLEPGRYTVDASFGGKTFQSAITVKPGETARRVFVWPQQYLELEG